MTGGGTLAIEAALIACRVAPYLLRAGGRPPAAAAWHDTAPGAWQKLVAEAEANVRASPPHPITANDLSPDALAIARAAADRAGVGDAIAFSCEDVARHGFGPGVVVANPPWGGRRLEGADAAWTALGEALKGRAPGSRAYVLSGNQEAPKLLKMRPSQKTRVAAMGVDLTWLRYDVRAPKAAPPPPPPRSPADGPPPPPDEVFEAARAAAVAGGYGLRAGDWICPDCGNNNYASRAFCQRCERGFAAGDCRVVQKGEEVARPARRKYD